MTDKKTQRKFTETESREILSSVFFLMEDGKSLRKACKINEISARTALDWIEKYELHTQYARAREELMDFWAEQVLDIADDSTFDSIETEAGERLNSEFVKRAKLRVDSRKWLLSKLAPKKYGDKLDLTSSDNSMTPPKTIMLVAAKNGD